MSWLVILIVVLSIFILIYIFYPSIKKMFSSKVIKDKSSSNRSIERQNGRAVKRQKKLDAKKEKIEERQEKKDKYNEDVSKKIEIVENKGDLFSDKPATPIEDPDSKVNYENFDLDGLFESDSKNENIINLKGDEEKKEEAEKNDNLFSNNFDEIFEKYFSNDKRPEIISRKNRNGVEINSDGSVDSDSEEEIADFLKENIIAGNENDIKRQFDNLPDEMKALLLSNFLDKKDF